MNTAKFFQQLLGKWKVSRLIPGYARTQGEACFSRIKTEANALYYHEQGQFTLMLKNTRSTLRCYRDYLYSYQTEQDMISVHFVEGESRGRLFHTFQFSTEDRVLIARGEHCCGPDVYHAIYQFVNKDAFKIIYTAKGPNKNYQSHTLFQR